MRFVLAAVFLCSISPSFAATWEEADVKIAACFATMDGDAALAVVNAKFGRRTPSAAQLADTSLVNEAEAEALRQRILKTRPCREMRFAAVRAHHPLLEPAYTTLYYQADQAFDYLREGSISYGVANRLASESLGEFQKRSNEYFGADEPKRRALAAFWLDALQRAHSNPPPPTAYGDKCHWRGLNISCEQ